MNLTSPLHFQSKPLTSSLCVCNMSLIYVLNYTNLHLTYPLQVPAMWLIFSDMFLLHPWCPYNTDIFFSLSLIHSKLVPNTSLNLIIISITYSILHTPRAEKRPILVKWLVETWQLCYSQNGAHIIRFLGFGLSDWA